MLIIKYLCLFSLSFYLVTSHLLRQKSARSAVFHHVFHSNNQKLNVTPLAIISNITQPGACSNLCLKNEGCLSVNLAITGSRNCELLAEDRSTKTEAENYAYYDTVVRNLCNEKDTCYPCSCWSAEFYRSPCICRKLRGKMHQHTPPWVFYAIINPFNHHILAIGGANYVYIFLLHIPQVYPNVWHLHTTGSVNMIKYRRDGVICGLGGVRVWIWNGQWIPKVYTTGSFDCTHKGFLTISSASFDLHSTKLDGTATAKVALGAITRIQEHGKYWYAIGKQCKCVMRHETIPSPTVNKWEIITTSPGSSIEFKVAFNDISYSLHEDRNIYEWYDTEDRWVMIQEGPCQSFDVYHIIICVKPDGTISSNYGEYVPRPNIHIPFKTLNATERTTPYGRGMDEAGNTRISLDLIANNIALDQFGKGYVLQKGDGEDIVIGNFENTVLRSPMIMDIGGVLTVSLWLRTTTQSLLQDGTFLSNSKFRGLYMSVEEYDSATTTIKTAMQTGNKLHIVNKNVANNVLYAWTHIAVVWEMNGPCLRLYVNGVLGAGNCNSQDKLGDADPFYRLHIHSKAVYLSDLAIWYAVLGDDQISQLYQSDLSASGWNKKFTVVTESSCEALKRQRPYSTSGYYWILLDGKLMSVYCDMVTDGGGWMKISHRDYAVSGNGQYSNVTTLSELVRKDVIISVEGLSTLRNLINFKQMRFRCSNLGTHDRIVDIATTRSAVIDYFTGATSERPYACGGYYRLEEDNSIVSSNCTAWKDGKFSHPYSTILLRNSVFALENERAYGYKKCDDNLASGGNFEHYVR